MAIWTSKSSKKQNKSNTFQRMCKSNVHIARFCLVKIARRSASLFANETAVKSRLKDTKISKTKAEQFDRKKERKKERKWSFYSVCFLFALDVIYVYIMDTPRILCVCAVHAHQQIWARTHDSNTATLIQTSKRQRERRKLFSYFNRAITSIAVHSKCIQTHRHWHSFGVHHRKWIEKRDVFYIKNWIAHIAQCLFMCRRDDYKGTEWSCDHLIRLVDISFIPTFDGEMGLHVWNLGGPLAKSHELKMFFFRHWTDFILIISIKETTNYLGMSTSSGNSGHKLLKYLHLFSQSK